jgi:hypothetical protein
LTYFLAVATSILSVRQRAFCTSAAKPVLACGRDCGKFAGLNRLVRLRGQGFIKARIK